MSILAAVSRRRSSEDQRESLAQSDGLAALRARDEALIAWIDALVEGKYDAPAHKGDDRLLLAVGKLAAKLAELASTSLDGIVDLNIQSNETAISAARMLTA